MSVEAVWASPQRSEGGKACAASAVLLHPANDARDAVDGDLRAIRNSARRIRDAQHHRHAALAPERREMRRAAAAFGDDGGDAWEDMAERRSGDAGDQDVSRRDAGHLTLAVDDDSSSRGPSDAGGMTAQPWML